jgi:spore germination cell wall hydrolase CwlJ-like protein
MILRSYTALIIGLSLVFGAFLASGIQLSDADAETEQSQSQRLFAPAANFTLHNTDEARREQLRCLALNIYWEARSEPIAGQLAVAAVTLNRVQNPRFPSDVCDVVRQGGEIRRHRCQFSWWCDGKKDDPVNAESWRRATTLARLVSAGIAKDPTNGALWYHADYVNPAWAQRMERVTKIGRHIFYTDNQPWAVDVTQNEGLDAGQISTPALYSN